MDQAPLAYQFFHRMCQVSHRTFGVQTLSASLPPVNSQFRLWLTSSLDPIYRLGKKVRVMVLQEISRREIRSKAARDVTCDYTAGRINIVHMVVRRRKKRGFISKTRDVGRTTHLPSSINVWQNLQPVSHAHSSSHSPKYAVGRATATRVFNNPPRYNNCNVRERATDLSKQ